MRNRPPGYPLNPPTVELSPQELQVLSLFAKRRHNSNRRNGVPERSILSDGADRETRGLIGEYGVCKLIGERPDYKVSPRIGGHDGFWPALGLSFDVKTHAGHAVMNANRCDLFVEKSKRRGEAEIYVLAVLFGNILEVPGFAYENEVFAAPIRDPGGYGHPCHVLPMPKLHSFTGLLVRAANLQNAR